MAKGSSSAPAPPDPAATASAQAGLNTETARLQALLSRYTQNTPYGSLTWSRPNATTGALAGNQPATLGFGSDATTNQGMPGTPATPGTPGTPGTPATPGQQNIYRDEGGNNYRDMNTGRVVQFASPPGVDSGDGIYYSDSPGSAAIPGTPGYAGSPGTSGGFSATSPASGGDAYDPNDVWQSNITLSPEGQEQFNTQNRIARALSGLGEGGIDRVASAQSQPFSLDGLPGAPQADAETRKRVEESLYNRSKSYLDPLYAQREREMMTSLSDRGIPLGSEAYGTATGDFNRARQADYQNAIDSGIAGGGAEESRQFGLQSSARERAIQEKSFLRSQPLNELAALLGQSGGVQLPQFTQPGGVGVAPTDITGPTNLAYQGQLANFNAGQQRRSSNLGGLFGLAGTLGAGALAAPAGGWLASIGSARSIKEANAPVDVLDKVMAMPVERWRYKDGVPYPGGDHIGPYAEDFHRLFGVGDNQTILLQDAVGICLRAIQELSAKIERLEAA